VHVALVLCKLYPGMQCSGTDGAAGYSHYNDFLVINCTHFITVMMYIFDILDYINYQNALSILCDDQPS
jgi:hypothetical protein